MFLTQISERNFSMLSRLTRPKTKPVQANDVIKIKSNQIGKPDAHLKWNKSVRMYSEFGKNSNQTMNIIHFRNLFLRFFLFTKAWLTAHGMIERNKFQLRNKYIGVDEI
jgi:hypothetical protein